ncbi:MAG: hypothetical protein WC326_04360 [Candidatus Delongbacteria bacterium]
MKIVLLFVPLLAALLAGCRPEAQLARLERRYLPETEYRIQVLMSSRRSLFRGPTGGELSPAMEDYFQELNTTQRLRLGPVSDGVARLEMDMLDYRIKEPGLALKLDLEGCVARADYDTSSLALRWLGLADTTWQGGRAPADSGWALEVLGRDDAAAYLASSMELLAASLADSTRELLPGQGYQESQHQSTTIGAHDVAWTEIRRVTLRSLEQDVAKLDVVVELVPDPQADGLRIMLEGGGRGRMEFDLRRRCTLLHQLDTQMSIEIDDGAVTWLARSETGLDIRTTIQPWSAGKE